MLSKKDVALTFDKEGENQAKYQSSNKAVIGYFISVSLYDFPSTKYEGYANTLSCSVEKAY